MKIDLVAHQKYVEQTFSKRHINRVILNEIKGDSDLVDLINQSVDAVNTWMSKSYFPAKDSRLAQLATRDIYTVVQQIFVVVIQITKPMLFTAVVGEITGALKMTNKIEGTKTAAELLAVMCEVGLFDITKQDKFESLMLVSNYALDDHTIEFIQRTKYLPPMVVPPNTVTKNYCKAYLTEASSLILRNGNHHDKDICLDSVNKFNQIPLSLNKRLLTSLSERPKRKFVDPEKKEQWTKFVKDSYETYRDLIQVGNKFYLTHKLDVRGRTYSQGYHVTTQGNEFRKAIIEFTDKEVITI
jgi:hypothetical protein